MKTNHFQFSSLQNIRTVGRINFRRIANLNVKGKINKAFRGKQRRASLGQSGQGKVSNTSLVCQREDSWSRPGMGNGGRAQRFGGWGMSVAYGFEKLKHRRYMAAMEGFQIPSTVAQVFPLHLLLGQGQLSLLGKGLRAHS